MTDSQSLARNHESADLEKNTITKESIAKVSAPLKAMVPPTVHVRAMITWTAIFPLVTLGFYAIKPFASEWSPVLRAFVLSIVVVPLAVYIVVPRLMRAYGQIVVRKNRHP